MVNRREFLRTAGAAGTATLAGVAGCLGGTGSAVTFVLTPAESDVDVQAQYRGLFSYLETETDAEIESTVAADYTAVYQALRNDRVELADASPTLAVVGGDEGTLDVIGIRVAFGSAKYFSFLTTTPDSSIESLADLDGEAVAFADRLSTSGSLFPLYMLRQAGLDVGDAPSGDPVDFEGRWSGSHDQSVSSLINRDEIVAGGSGAFVAMPHVPAAQLPQRVVDVAPGSDDAGTEDPSLDLLQASEPIPRAPIVARSNWDATIRSDLETALLGATESDLQGGTAEEEIWFTGVESATVDDYEPVANVKETLGLEFGN
ncbi:phosphate-binding protein [Halobacteriales archaeon SW_7_68_16]|nr:MAG: phosphate-binding protein [Halobacteriales archaeon SW_7_68_16]